MEVVVGMGGRLAVIKEMVFHKYILFIELESGEWRC